MFVVIGCGGSDGDSDGGGSLAPSAGEGGASAQVPVSADVAESPIPETPTDKDVSKVCVAIDGMTFINNVGDIVNWTPESFEQAASSDDCVPVDGEIPTDGDGNPLFVVLNLTDLTGVDLVRLLEDQLMAAGDYVSVALSTVDEGGYGDILNTPYSHVRDIFGDLKPLKVADELTFEGLNLNFDIPQTITFAFDLRSMLQLKEDAYEMKNRGLRLVNNDEAGSIIGSINPSACAASMVDAYVYLYESDTESYGDMGSETEPVVTAKVGQDNSYEFKHIESGDYDLTLVCNGLFDLPDVVNDVLNVDSSQKGYKLGKDVLNIDFQ
ncbi:hypothetical protein A3K86_04860 [Photobacterium jeanii]|uniref:DUF4382 domain-containing protein n=2 Tax=Photobacterium jeanii TaxID=858640 RepID=A0A178KLV4_9GAMM|nr:hypothetical protein A3K86_04860 [Photobacterium jeanii]